VAIRSKQLASGKSRNENCKQEKTHLLIILTPSNLTAQMPLLVVQVLQLQVQRVDLLPGFAGFLLGAADSEDGFAVQAAELG
jgi:hypothetical protein